MSTANPEMGADAGQQADISPEDQISSLLNDEGGFREADEEAEAEESEAEGDTEAEEEEADEAEEEESEEESADEEEAEDEADESDEEEPEKFETLEELAEAAGMTVDDLRSLYKTKIKVQGEEQEVTLDELEQATMFEADYRKKTAELADQRREFEEQAQQYQQQFSQQLEDAAATVSLAEQQLLAEYQGVDWDALRQSDPAQYAANKQHMTERQQQLEAQKQKLKAQFAQQREAEEQQAQAEAIEHLEKQRQALPQVIPEWVDEGKRKAESKKLKQYLTGAFEGDLAVRDEDLQALTDPRAVALFRKAMLYDELQSGVQTAKKKVKKLPKVTKPGKQTSSKEQRAKANKGKRERLKKTGSVDDAASVFLDIL